MRRVKIGDVYYIKVPNGYKIFQYAYDIPRKGRYIRVFDGLYQEIPKNLSDIVHSQHSYIISLYITKACRIGLAVFLDNIPVPSEYPFPRYQLNFLINYRLQQVEQIHVMSADATTSVWQWFDVDSIDKLPQEYRNTTLLNSHVSPDWLLYLFDVGFDLKHIERFHLGSNPEEILKPYIEIIDYFDPGYSSGIN